MKERKKVNFVPNDTKLPTWEQYCKDIGSSKSSVDRWLRKWWGSEKEVEIPPLPRKEYGVVYADPPWQYDNKIMKWGAAELHYPTLSIEELSTMTIPAADNAILFLLVKSKFRSAVTDLFQEGKLRKSQKCSEGRKLQ